ncbi:MAG: type transport system permease protein, partial [Gaiellaceae bacterium]|nr:type transport system permease protein [Gaiellaceae bacterium]
MTAIAGRSADVAAGRVTQLAVIRSEWIKLRSLRSTWWSLLATVVIIVGLGTLFTSLRAHRFDAEGRIGFDPTLVSLRGVFLAQLAIGVLGV